MPVISSTYYYAVVSYIDDLSFYNAKENTDTFSISFNGINNSSSLTNLNANNLSNSNTIINSNFNSQNNLKYVTNFVTVTNTITLTNTYTFTNSLVTNNIKNSNSSSLNNNGSISSGNNNDFNNYRSQYNRALAEFKWGNYSQAASILEPVSRRNVNRTLYYEINMLLGKCYKYLRQKKNSLDAFNRIKSYNTQEVNFWINQVLSDL